MAVAKTGNAMVIRCGVQFLLIIRSTVDATIKADFARKIARLVETYAQPAEYARTMASVLDAAGPAAPKDLASQVRMPAPEPTWAA